MRITSNMTADNSLFNIQRGQSRLNSLQESISSGQNVNRPSDNPIAGRSLMEIGDRLKTLDQYASNINKATSWMKFTNTALEGMSAILGQAKRIAGTINIGSADPSIRQSVHDQLVELKKQVVDMGNLQFGEQYIFGGSKNLAPPFTMTPPANTVTYGGDGAQMSIEITQNSDQPLNVTGDRLLQGIGANPSYGTVDIFQAFDDMIAAVGDSVTPSNVAALSQASTALQNGAKQINIATSDVLSRMTRLDNMNKLNDNYKNTLLSISTSIQEVDYAKLGIQLNSQKTAFEASLSSTAKLSQLSLLNYL